MSVLPELSEPQNCKAVAKERSASSLRRPSRSNAEQPHLILYPHVASRINNSMNIAFIGLGNMGSAMATNLIKAGHTLSVYNRSKTRADALKPLGARVAATPGEAAAGAEVAITMLADDHALESVIFGKGSLLDSLPPNAIHVSMSTISVALSRRLAAAHAEHKQHYVSAPVFGRPEAAAAAKLFIVAAGPAAQIERCRPLFDAMGQKTFLAGDDASGANLMKLAGNFLITAVIEGSGGKLCPGAQGRTRCQPVP